MVCEGFALPKDYVIQTNNPLGPDITALRRAQNPEMKHESDFIGGQKRSVRDDGVTVVEFEPDDVNSTRWIAPR